MEEAKHDIFISYSRQDQALVIPLVERINKEVGALCWIDLDGIESGEEFEEVIMKGIEESQVVLFMLSEASLKSPWTKREVYYAESENKRIVPVLIDGDKLRGWFKFHFGNLDYIDVHSAEHQEKLISNLKSWVGIPAQEIKASKPQPKQPTVSVTRSGLVRFQDEKTKLYGFKDKQTGQTALPAKWTWVMEFSEGLAAVEERGSRNGFINQKGERVLFCDQNCSFSEFHEGLAAVYVREHKYGRSDNHYGFIDKTGKLVIPCQYCHVGNFCEGLVWVKLEYGNYIYIDKFNQRAFSSSYKKASDFKEGFAVVEIEGEKRCKMIDKTGTVVADVLGMKSSLRIIRNSEGLFGLADRKGREVAPCLWTSIDNFHNGLAVVKNGQGLYGAVNEDGQLVLPCQWKNVRTDEGKNGRSLACVQDFNGKWGLYDGDGNKLVNCLWITIEKFPYETSGKERYAKVEDSNHKWGLVSSSGRIVSDCVWKEVRHFHEGMAAVKGAYDKWGYIDETGKNVISCIWCDACIFAEGMACVKDASGKYGFINKSGKLVIPCKWLNVDGSFYNGRIVVYGKRFGLMPAKWYRIDKKGNIEYPHGRQSDFGPSTHPTI